MICSILFQHVKSKPLPFWYLNCNYTFTFSFILKDVTSLNHSNWNLESGIAAILD